MSVSGLEDAVSRLGVSANRMFRLCGSTGMSTWMRPLRDGALVVQAESDDAEFTIMLYGRASPSDGESGGDIVQFSLPVKVEGEQSALESRLSEWNRRVILSKAYLDPEGDVMLDLSVPLISATDESLSELLVLWRRLVSEFMSFLAS